MTNLTATAGDITLATAGNDFTGAVNASGTNITLVDTNTITLGTVTASGDAVGDGGDEHHAKRHAAGLGATNLTATAGEHHADDGGQRLHGAVNASGTNITLVDTNRSTWGR